MDSALLRDVVLELAGMARDRTRLAQLLGVTESTAYGWIRLAEEGRFAADTNVRGEDNRIAKNLLIEATKAVEAGELELAEVDEFIKLHRPDDGAGADEQATKAPDGGQWEEFRAEQLKKGLDTLLAQLRSGVPVDTVIAGAKLVISMIDGGPMKK